MRHIINLRNSVIAVGFWGIVVFLVWKLNVVLPLGWAIVAALALFLAIVALISVLIEWGNGNGRWPGGLL